MLVDMKIPNYILRVVVSLVLGTVAGIILITEADAHVTLCMTSAIGYSIGLLILFSKKWSSHITSFFFSWILFYTVYTGTTLLVVERINDTGTLFNALSVKPDEAWTYHIFINFILLFIFAVKLDNVKTMFAGLWSAMLVAPSLFILEQFGRRLWDVETPKMIISYAIAGILLMIVYFVLKQYKSAWKTFLPWLRLFIIISLIIFVVITLIPCVMLLV